MLNFCDLGTGVHVDDSPGEHPDLADKEEGQHPDSRQAHHQVDDEEREYRHQAQGEQVERAFLFHPPVNGSQLVGKTSLYGFPEQVAGEQECECCPYG